MRSTLRVLLASFATVAFASVSYGDLLLVDSLGSDAVSVASGSTVTMTVNVNNPSGTDYTFDDIAAGATPVFTGTATAVKNADYLSGAGGPPLIAAGTTLTAPGTIPPLAFNGFIFGTTGGASTTLAAGAPLLDVANIAFTVTGDPGDTIVLSPIGLFGGDAVALAGAGVAGSGTLAGTLTVTIAQAIPEPSAFLCLGLVATSIGFVRRKRRA